MSPAILLATMLLEAFCLLYGMFSSPSPGINGKMPWRVMLAIAIAAAVILFALSSAHAASEVTCTAWVLKAKVNATKIEQIDKAYYWCLNQDLDPPLVDGVPSSRPVRREVDTARYPGCHHFRSYDPRSKTFLDYSHIRRSCP